MTIARWDEWTCPRCGLVGEHHKSPDPKRCKTCCKVDAAEDLYAACKVAASMRDGCGCGACHACVARAALAKADGMDGADRDDDRLATTAEIHVALDYERYFGGAP